MESKHFSKTNNKINSDIANVSKVSPGKIDDNTLSEKWLVFNFDTLEMVKQHNLEYDNNLRVYSNYLQRNIRDNKERQNRFYCISITILAFSFIIFIFFSGVVIRSLISAGSVDYKILASLFLASIEFVGVLVVIPKTIVSYLFNKEEIKAIIEMIKNLQSNDIELLKMAQKQNK